MFPRPSIILHPITFIKRWIVGDLLPLVQFTFGDGVGVGVAGFEGALQGGDFLTDFFPFGAVDANAVEAFAAGEDDVAALVVPGVVFVLLEDGKLHVVYQY